MKKTIQQEHQSANLNPGNPSSQPQAGTGKRGTRYPLTWEQRQAVIDRLVRVFAPLINEPPTDAEFPIWMESTDQLMELAWTLWKSGRIKDPATGRPLTMRCIATRLCAHLHRRLPANIYGVARQSRLTGRQPVVHYFGQLIYEGGLDPSVFVQWHRPVCFPRLRHYGKGVF